MGGRNVGGYGVLLYARKIVDVVVTTHLSRKRELTYNHVGRWGSRYLEIFEDN